MTSGGPFQPKTFYDSMKNLGGSALRARGSCFNTQEQSGASSPCCGYDVPRHHAASRLAEAPVMCGELDSLCCGWGGSGAPWGKPG